MNDALDEFGVDEDCNGGDGETATTLYISSTGLSTNAGTPAAPLDGILSAVVIARGNANIRNVVIAKSATPYDGYGLGALLSLGLQVVGGYDATTWARPGGNATARSETRIAIARTGEAVSGPSDGGQAPAASLTGVELANDPTAAVIPSDWPHSVVLMVNNAPQLTLRHVSLIASPGLNAPSATTADAGLPGPNGGAGVTTEGGLGGEFAGNACPNGAFASGGKAESRGLLANNFRNQNRYYVNGVNSSLNMNGFAGTGGRASGVVQSGVGTGFMSAALGGTSDGGISLPEDGRGAGTPVALKVDTNARLVISDPTPARQGLVGGGGGGGVSCGAYWDSSNGPTAFFGGGGGGSGGCGGLPGLNGRPGGSSIALIVNGSPPLLDTVSITTGNGGNGQSGGTGGTGGTGGAGGPATASTSSNCGGTSPATGGGGGAGGNGGGGGTGGNGGWSMGALFYGTTVPSSRLMNVTFTRGTGGMPGAAGAGGLGGAGGAGSGGTNGGSAGGVGLSGRPGEAGLVGVSADTGAAQ